MSWTQKEEAELRLKAMDGRFFYSEIAQMLGKSPGTVRWKANKLGLPSKLCREKVGKSNRKHHHLRLAVMTYFLTHTADQCQKKYKLTTSEFKSLMSAGYRDPKLRHLRKETRRHDTWSKRELQFLLTHAGLMPRDWIGEKLKRGSPICIKERFEKLGLSSRTLNGITLTQFTYMFGHRPRFMLETKAGPGRSNTPTYFKIIPWVWLEREISERRLETTEPFRQVVSTMALFQEWIHEGNALAKMKRIVRKKLENA